MKSGECVKCLTSITGNIVRAPLVAAGATAETGIISASSYQWEVRVLYGCYKLAEHTDVCSVSLVLFKKLGNKGECIGQNIVMY